MHTLRIVLMLTELIQKNKITDFTLGIENYYLMSSFYEKEWQFYDDYFRPILKEGISELSDLCKS